MSEIDLAEQLRDLRRRVAILERREIPIGLSTLHWHSYMAGGTAFLALAKSTATDVTGDGTAYTVIFGTEVLDTGGDFAVGTGFFTAPVTGYYLLGTQVALLGILSTHTTAVLGIYTTGRTYGSHHMNPYAVFSASGVVSLQATVLADMAATETASVGITVDNGTKVVDVYGDVSTARTRFWGLRLR